jgi:hypothetical protein
MYPRLSGAQASFLASRLDRQAARRDNASFPAALHMRCSIRCLSTALPFVAPVRSVTSVHAQQAAFLPPRTVLPPPSTRCATSRGSSAQLS